MTNSLGESTKNLINDYAQFADRSKLSLEEGYKLIVDNQEAFKQSIIDILNKFDGSFNPLLIELKANVGELSRQTLKLPEELNKSSNSLQESMQALKRILQTDLAQYLQTQSRITQDQSKSLSELGAYLTAISELQKENKNIQDLMTSLINYQNNFDNNMKNRDRDLKAHLENITAIMSRQKDLMTAHNQSAEALKIKYDDLNNLSSKLGNNLGNLGESLASSINQLQESSQNYHSQLAEYSKKALEALTNYADEYRAELESKIEGLKR
jgi:chromosome segregation ATPase